LTKEKKERILKDVYKHIPETYEKYFKKYGKTRWPYNKFLMKVRNEYPLAVLNEESENLLFYLAFSTPKLIDDINYFKIGFWVFGKEISKDHSKRKSFLKDGINFLENKILENYQNSCLFLETPLDFTPVVKFYEKYLGFEICNNKNKIESILESFGRKLKEIKEYSYTTENTDIYHIILLKND